MARIPIKKDKIPEKNKRMSKALSIEERRLSQVMEQRKTLEGTLSGVKDEIVNTNKMANKCSIAFDINNGKKHSKLVSKFFTIVSESIFEVQFNGSYGGANSWGMDGSGNPGGDV